MTVFGCGCADGNILTDLRIGFVYDTGVDIACFYPRKNFADILCENELGGNLIGKAEILENLFGVLTDRYGFRFADADFLYGVSGKGFKRIEDCCVLGGNQNNGR